MGDIVSQVDGGLAVVTIRRAAKRNTLTDEVIEDLWTAFDDLERHPEVRTVLLRGEGERAFSAGYDLTTLTGSGSAAEEDRLHALFDRIERFRFPVVALLRGYAVGGGCELALACDVRVAGDDVRMGMPPARLGLVYPMAGYERFVRTVGVAAAAEVFYTGRTYAAADCQRLGLVSLVVPAASAEDQASGLAREISENAPLSLQGTKRILRHLTSRPGASAEDVRELQWLFRSSLGTEDVVEGKLALAERRKPVFKGR